jgi:uncharacterized membrane protein YsdA (DUF1294 family)
MCSLFFIQEQNCNLGGLKKSRGGGKIIFHKKMRKKNFNQFWDVIFTQSLKIITFALRFFSRAY